jgi:transcriptional regulator with XRE-family HTH domain
MLDINTDCLYYYTAWWRFLTMVFDSNKLLQLRTERGFSLQQTVQLLRVKTGLQVSRNCIHLWEQGKNLPSVKSLMALAKFYGKEIGFFFRRD